MWRRKESIDEEKKIYWKKKRAKTIGASTGKKDDVADMTSLLTDAPFVAQARQRA